MILHLACIQVVEQLLNYSLLRLYTGIEALSSEKNKKTVMFLLKPFKGRALQFFVFVSHMGGVVN